MRGPIIEQPTTRENVFVCGGGCLYTDLDAAERTADSWDPREYRAYVVGPVTSTGDYAKHQRKRVTA